MNAPKKYRTNYADKIIQNSLDALKYAQLANNIYISASMQEEEFNQRETYLKMSKGLIENVSTVCQILLGQLQKYGAVETEKVHKWEEYVGTHTNTITDLIVGIMKSDKKRFKEYKK